MQYIDIHGHVNFPDYDKDREEVIGRAQQAGVLMITVGTDTETSRQAVELARTHENMWATVGIHPTETADSINMPALSALGEDGRVVAIGECGLDYFRAEGTEEAQKEVFASHIHLANTLGKPLMLHIRNGNGRNAYLEAVDILKSSSNVLGNFHFFAGTTEDMKVILDLGYSVSFTGVVTFARDYDELIKYAPLERIMSETDCPFVAPAPNRGKRNEPSYIPHIVDAIAKIRNEDTGYVAAKLLDNARKFFRIAPGFD